MKINALAVALLVSWPNAAPAQTLTLPAKAVKLDGRGAELGLAAKVVAIVATARPTIEIGSTDPKTGRATLVIHDGIRRRVDDDKAKQEVQQVIRDWGRFTLTDDLEKADLILAIVESTVAAGSFSQMAGDTTHRLRDTLGVFARGVPEPIWVDMATESTLGALTGSAASRVAEKFRRALETASQKARK